MPLIRLPFSDNEFSRKVLLSNLPAFFFNPAFQADFPDTAQIEKFHIMRILSGFISYRRYQSAWKISAVAAKLDAFGFDAIQRCATVRLQMKMLSILLAASFAGNFFFGHIHFGMNQFGKLIGQIFFIQFAVEAIQSTG